MNIKSLKLLTTNPDKVEALRKHGFQVEMMASPVKVAVTDTNRRLL